MGVKHPERRLAGVRHGVHERIAAHAGVRVPGERDVDVAAIDDVGWAWVIPVILLPLIREFRALDDSVPGQVGLLIPETDARETTAAAPIPRFAKSS